MAIGSFSDLHSQGLQALRKHISQAVWWGLFLISAMNARSIIILKTEQAFICKAERVVTVITLAKSGTTEDMRRRDSGDREGLRVRSETWDRHRSGGCWLFG